MNAGRELDAMVAEKVMGLKLCRETLEAFDAGHRCEDLPADSVERYSTDIKAAWEIPPRMPGHFFKIEMVSALPHWRATFSPLISQGRLPADVDVFAPTAPMAICLAALKAVGVEVPA